MSTTGPEGPRHGTLHLADGWRIDPLALERLDHQLGRAPAGVVGVAAAPSPLPPGSSYRVQAERAALEAWEVVRPLEGSSAAGAVLVRPGIHVRDDDGTLVVADGDLLLDPGAHVHDTATVLSELRPASMLGRPPFPRRPVTVFLAGEHGVGPAEWAASIADDLLDAELEARLALRDAVAPPALVQPAAAGEDTVEALRPDVIVALDATAVSQSQRWCPGNRTMVVVEAVDDGSRRVELVSWQIGHDRGRVRARVGTGARAADLAPLVTRLCGGPHPLPPRDTTSLGEVVVPVGVSGDDDRDLDEEEEEVS